jgi:hypothetical protein
MAAPTTSILPRNRRRSRSRSTTRSSARQPIDAKDKGTAAPADKDAKNPTKGADLVRDDKTGKFAPKDPGAKDAPVAKDAPAKLGADPAKVQPAAAAKPAAAEKPAAADPNAPKHAAPARFSDDAKAVWETAPEPVKAELGII